MEGSADSEKLRNGLLMLGAGILLLSLILISTLSDRSASEADLAEVGNNNSSNTVDPSTDVVSSEKATNPSTATFTSTATSIPLLFNDKGEGIPIVWGEYPAPSTWPSTPVPPPMGILPIPDDQLNILILGNDYRPHRGARTDVMMLLSLNLSSGKASLISFPRATYVYAPGWTMMPLHTVKPRGGYDLLKDTFEYNFGVRPDRYINISMMSFEYVIDSLGGVDVEVREYLSDPTYAGGRFSVEPGIVHMDGKMARWYARSRMTSSDFARAHRQQALLKAIFNRLMEIDAITRAPELYQEYILDVETDLTLTDLIDLAPLAVQLSDTSRVSQYTVNLDHVYSWTTPKDHAYVFLPDREALLNLLLIALVSVN